MSRSRVPAVTLVATLALNLLSVAPLTNAESRYELVAPVAVTTPTEEVPVPLPLEYATPIPTKPQTAADVEDATLSSEIGDIVGVIALVGLMLAWFGWNSVYNPNGRFAEQHRQQ